jgi:hypothetical protein
VPTHEGGSQSVADGCKTVGRPVAVIELARNQLGARDDIPPSCAEAAGRAGSNEWVSAHAEAESTRVGEYDNLRSVLPVHMFCSEPYKALDVGRMCFRPEPRPGVQVKMCLVICV